jgi:hypothetical protein
MPVNKPKESSAADFGKGGLKVERESAAHPEQRSTASCIDCSLRHCFVEGLMVHYIGPVVLEATSLKV